MKKEKPNLKRVKIDDHIKASKGGNSTATVRKRGRPRKNPEHINDSGKINLGGNSSSIPTDSGQVEENISPAQPPTIEPVYDTTEEAKGFLRAPFDIAAGLTGIQKLALYPAQLDAMAPSFKVVYDKRIAPKLGEDADLIAFAIVASGVIFEKVQVFREERPKMKAAEAAAEAHSKSDTTGFQTLPSIPVEHHA